MSESAPTTDIEVPAALAFVRPEAADSDALLHLVARRAVRLGYAHEGFEKALKDRELAHPTGLPTAVPVAIPHADADHVRKPALAVVAPAAPVIFGEMGSRDRTVAARLVVVMLVNDATRQVPLLGRLIAVLQRPDLDEALLQGASTPERLADGFARLLR